MRPRRRTPIVGAWEFQFTHPGRGATSKLSVHEIFGDRFNSRTPGGVRLGRRNEADIASTVSIHAPREGCDIALILSASWHTSFNSRTPGGVRLQTRVRERGQTWGFNSRTPGGVRLKLLFEARHLVDVSIHAPREGCDLQVKLYLLIKVCFNSRTPGGVRLTLDVVILNFGRFQFTHPGRGATLTDYIDTLKRYVSIHAPREGCDRR